jgi:hypothetical protein
MSYLHSLIWEWEIPHIAGVLDPNSVQYRKYLMAGIDLAILEIM